MKTPIHAIFFCLTLTAALQQAYGQCAFSVANPTPCATESVAFSIDNPAGGATYEWDFNEDGEVDAVGSSVSFSFPFSHADASYLVSVSENGAPCASQPVQVVAVPDPSIGVPPGIVSMTGNEIQACNGATSIELEIYNASATYASNVSYEINWGDGTPPETFDNNTFSLINTISHTYNGLGYYTLFVTATHENGCFFTNMYTFYNGGNPSVGLVIPGNTVGLCAPATLEFPITNTGNNPPGTIYTVFVSGEAVATYTQDELPEVFAYTFEEHSCGAVTSTGNYENAYDIRIVASNPCNSSTATIEPIEISEPPTPFFLVNALGGGNCPGTIIELENATAATEVVSGTPSNCLEVLSPNWTILQGTPGQDWEIVSGSLFGSNQLQLSFNTPGVYTIEMTVFSFACGAFTFSQDITVAAPPTLSVAVDPVALDSIAAGGCAPITVPFLNDTDSAGLAFSWTIAPPTGWVFTPGSDENDFAPALEFLEGGTYAISMTAANACTEVSWDTLLNIPGAPGIQLGPLPDFCLEATLDFSAALVSLSENEHPITAVSWSFPGSDTPVSSETYPAGIFYDSPGNYTIQLTAENACGSTTAEASFAVEAPAVLSLPSDQAACTSDSAFQLLATPAGGAWSGTGVSPEGLFDPQAANTGANVLTYSFGMGACLVSDQITVSLSPAPVVQAGPDLILCQSDAPVALSGNAPLGGFWSGPGLSGPNQDLFDPNLVSPDTFRLIYAFTDPFNGCAGLDDRFVIVRPVPQADFELPGFACVQESLSLDNLSTGADTYTWHWGNGSTSSEFQPAFSYQDTGLYTITLEVENLAGCNDEVQADIFIAAPPALAFTPSLDAACPGETIQVTNHSYGYEAAYFWDFGNGQISTAEQPNFSLQYAPGYLADTLYTIELTASNLCGSVSVQQPITIHPYPLAEFGILVDTGCAPLSVTFNNSSFGSPHTFFWDFGNGQTSTDSLPGPQLFPGDTLPVAYTVYLEVANDCGSDSISQPLVVEPETVTAFFNTSNTEGCAPFQVDFEDYSTPGTFISWNFGDGNIVSGETISHTFVEPGIYTVRHYASNSCASDSSTIQIEVLPVPAVSFELPELACAGQEMFIQNTSSNLGGNLWVFGAGDSSILTNLTILLDEPGAYPISLTGYAANTGCAVTVTQTLTIQETPEAALQVGPAAGCIPLEVSFQNNSQNAEFFIWHFGDSNTSNQPQPNHTYLQAGAYEASLIAINQAGCRDTVAFAPIQAWPLPQAAFEPETPALCGLPATVQFFNQSAGATGFAWDFGDGSASPLFEPGNTYQQTGDFLVTLTATNEYGCTDQAEQTLPVYPQPEADFEILSGRGCEPFEANFSSFATQADWVQWNFGDGTTSEDIAPTHLYTSEGIYDVQLIAGAGGYCFDTLDLGGLVEVLPTPTAAFIYQVDPIGEPAGSIQFINQSVDADTFYWDFGDGVLSVEADPVHRYYTGGARQVLLRATSANGCVDQVVETITPPVFGRLYVPNAFTPNQGPGDARYFFPKGVGLKEYHLQIFSTYGQLLWETSELSEGQPVEGWDGTYQNVLLPQDTYVWKIRALFNDGTEWPGVPDPNGALRKIGAVVLIR